jgi:hypothetical protein
MTPSYAVLPSGAKKQGIVTSAAICTGTRTVTNATRTLKNRRKPSDEKLALVLVAMGPMIVLPAVAQNPGGAERARVANTVEKLDGDRLTINVAGGPTQTVMLSADATIYRVEKRRLSDIKPGAFVASGGVRGTDQNSCWAAHLSRIDARGRRRSASLGNSNNAGGVPRSRLWSHRGALRG